MSWAGRSWGTSKKERSIWMLMLLINNLAAKWLTRLRKVYSSCLRFWILSISCFLSSPCLLLLCSLYTLMWCFCLPHSSFFPSPFFYLTFLKQRGKLNFKIFIRAQLAAGDDSRCWLHFKVFQCQTSVSAASSQKTREIINSLWILKTINIIIYL